VVLDLQKAGEVSDPSITSQMWESGV